MGEILNEFREVDGSKFGEGVHVLVEVGFTVIVDA